MTTTPNPPRDDGPQPLPPALASGLRGLRTDIAPGRDLWPAIAAGIASGTPVEGTGRGPAAGTPARRDWRRHFRRRNAGYAAAAAVVLAAGIGWQLWPASQLPRLPPPAPDSVVATGAAADAGSPLLVAADALAREYQGALREVQASSEALAAGGADPWLDAELERSATEVRAALARDPDALHLFHRLQRIYAHRLALSLRPA